jgi:protocatechuate 3,4-dioxygenase beta subunit
VQHSIRVDADQFAPLLVRNPDAGDPTFYMVRGATLTGRVVDAETLEPLPGARVLLWSDTFSGSTTRGDRSVSYGQQPIVLGDVRADERGGFAIAHVPAFGVHPVGIPTLKMGVTTLGHIGALAPGYAPGTADVTLPLEGATVSFELKCFPAARIRGRVVDEQGAPVAGAYISSRGVDPKSGMRALGETMTLPSTRTDADGRYVVQGVAASRELATATVQAERLTTEDDPEQSSATVTISAHEDALAPDVILRSPAIVAVEVMDADGAAVPGARARIQRKGGSVRWFTCDTDGRRTFEVPASRTKEPVQVLVHAEHFADQQSEPLTVEPGKLREMLIELAPAHRLTGVLRDANGPVPGRVFVYDGTVPLAEATRFDAHQKRSLYKFQQVTPAGRFVIDGLPAGPYHLVASHLEPNQETKATLESVPTDSSDVAIVLPPVTQVAKGEIEVTLVDLGSAEPVIARPRSFALASAERSTNEYGSAVAPGVFVLVGVSLGTFTVVADVEGFARSDPTPVTLSRAGERARVTVLLARPARLTGTARVGRNPIANARLFFEADGRIVNAETGADGEFTADGLRAGARYRVTALARLAGDVEPNWFACRTGAEVAVTARELTDVGLDLLPAHGLVVRIVCDRLPQKDHGTDAQRRTADASRLIVRDATGALVVEHNPLTREGIERVVPEGRYTIEVQVDGSPTQQLEAQVERGARSTTLEVVIP